MVWRRQEGYAAKVLLLYNRTLIGATLENRILVLTIDVSQCPNKVECVLGDPSLNIVTEASVYGNTHYRFPLPIAGVAREAVRNVVERTVPHPWESLE
jgi:hypothetical protein